MKSFIGGACFAVALLLAVSSVSAGTCKEPSIGSNPDFIPNILPFSFTYANGLEIFDHNGDGLLDISIADAQAEKFYLLTAQKNGSYTREIIGSTIGWYERHKVLGPNHFAVILHRAHKILSVKKVNGKWVEKTILTEDSPFDFVLKDINADGIQDYAISTHGHGTLALHSSNETGFDRKVLLDTPGHTKHVSHFGTSEIIVSITNPGSLLKFDTKTNTFDFITNTFDFNGNSIETPVMGDSADIDGDGDIDFVIAAGGNTLVHDACKRGIFWFENREDTPRGGWIRHEVHVPALTAYEAKLSDIDQDGDMDIIGSHFESPAQVILYENDNGKWNVTSLFMSYEISGANQINVADMNEDGKLDIVVPFNDKDSRIIIFEQH